MGVTSRTSFIFLSITKRKTKVIKQEVSKGRNRMIKYNYETTKCDGHFILPPGKISTLDIP